MSLITYLDDGADPPVRTGVQIYPTGNPGNPTAVTLYADIAGQPGTAGWLAKFAEHMQTQLDHRIPLNDPDWADDPDVLVDPERENFFHDSGDLVARSWIAEVEWDDDQIKVTMHRAKNR